MSIKKAISAGLSLACVMANSLYLLPCEARAVADAKPTVMAAASAKAVSQTKTVQQTKAAKQTKQEKPPLVEKYLLDGELAAGEKALESRLFDKPADDQARFGLGVLVFLQSVEGLIQDLHRYGFMDFEDIPGPTRALKKVIAPNSNADKLSYADARQIVERLRARLVKAESTLSQIKDDNVKLPLHFGMIKMDLSGGGVVQDDERLWKLFASVSGHTDIPEETAKNFYIKFDRGDVHWLQGYCHVLLTICEVYLAHDSEELFKRTAHLLFSNPDSPYLYLKSSAKKHKYHMGDMSFLDIIAFIHLINCKVVEPERMKTALTHMEAVVTQSRISWKYILAEKDDDHEWLPNPNQTGVIPNVKVTQEMVTSWAEVMNECERILQGKALIPFWRGDDETLGINLRKVMLEPRDFDLVLWVQGTAAAPYLEHGPISGRAKWSTLTNDFGRNFPGFALWFN